MGWGKHDIEGKERERKRGGIVGKGRKGGGLWEGKKGKGEHSLDRCKIGRWLVFMYFLFYNYLDSQ